MAAMSKQHKEAMAVGRRQSRVVKDYLQALERGRKRGPKVTAEKLRERIDKTWEAIAVEKDPSKRVQLIQARLDDEERLESLGDDVPLEELEASFVEVAAEYGDRKGLTYTAWREIGVPAAVLKQAGVARTRR